MCLILQEPLVGECQQVGDRDISKHDRQTPTFEEGAGKPRLNLWRRVWGNRWHHLCGCHGGGRREAPGCQGLPQFAWSRIAMCECVLGLRQAARGCPAHRAGQDPDCYLGGLLQRPWLPDNRGPCHGSVWVGRHSQGTCVLGRPCGARGRGEEEQGGAGMLAPPCPGPEEAAGWRLAARPGKLVLAGAQASVCMYMMRPGTFAV